MTSILERIELVLLIIGILGWIIGLGGGIFFGQSDTFVFRGIMIGCMALALFFILSGRWPEDSIKSIIIVSGASLGLWHFSRLIFRLLFNRLGESNFDGRGFLLKNILAPIIVGLVLYILTGNTSIAFITVPIIGIISASIGI